MNRIIRLLLILSCLAVLGQVYAQFDDPKTIEVGPHGGISYYMGDLNPMKPFAMSDWQYGGVIRYNQDSRWSFRFEYTHATVKASDEKIKWRPERGLNFMANINDFSLMAEFNFVEYFTGNPKRNVSPYIFGGISLFQYAPSVQLTIKDPMGKTKPFDTLVNLRDYETEPPMADTSWFDKYFAVRSKPMSISIPFGLGVKFSLSRHMAATVEWRMHKTFTDYLDDVATVYPNKNSAFEYKHVEYLKDAQGQFVIHDGKKVVDEENSYALIYNLSDPTAEILQYNVDSDEKVLYPLDEDGKPIKDPAVGKYKADQQRGNSAFNDWFGMINVSLTWKFNLPDGRGCNLSKF